MTPIVESSLKAAPGTGEVVLGAIVGVISLTERLFEYQSKTMQFLKDIGVRLRTLLIYEKELYTGIDSVKAALVLVYGDILVFCSKAFAFLTTKGDLRARIKGFRFMTFQDFEGRLGEVVDTFKRHMVQLETRALEQDKLRLQEIRTAQATQASDFVKVIDRQDEHHKRQEELSQRILARLEQDKKEQENEIAKKAQQQALQWLSPLNFAKIYAEITSQHLEGTGEWLLKHEDYISWKTDESKSAILWVKGKPGCGKSLLAARVIQDLALTAGTSDAHVYAFCRRDERALQSRASLLGSLARQIIVQRGQSTTSLESEFHSQGKPSINSIKKLLREAISQSDRSYLVIDGLDECGEDDSIDFAQDLADIIEDINQNVVKIVVFSRPDPNFRASFANAIEIHPDYGYNESDIKAYIGFVIESTLDKQDIKNGLHEQCLRKAQGMFQWVALFQKTIRNRTIRRHVLKNLDSIADGLEPMYDILLSNIHRSIRPTAWLIFLWVTHGERPLNTYELRDAIADMDNVSWSRELEREPNEEHLVSICANLVYIDQDGFVCLIHDSVRMHMENKHPAQNSEWRQEYAKLLNQVHYILARACLKYLSFLDFNNAYDETTADLRRWATVVMEAPFVRYAALNWGWHVSLVPDDKLTRPLVNKLMQSESRLHLSVIMIAWYDNNSWGIMSRWAVDSLRLPSLSWFGLIEHAKAISQEMFPAKWSYIELISALQAACFCRHHRMAHWLLDMLRDESTDEDADTDIMTPLAFSVCNDWSDVVVRLLDMYQAFDIDATSPNWKVTLLALAIHCHSLGIAHILVERGAKANRHTSDGRPPLLLAIGIGNSAFVNLLLDANADVNLVDNTGITALHLAVAFENPPIVDILLSRGADVHAEAPLLSGKTPFHWAAKSGSTAAMHHILKHHPNLDINAKSQGGVSPLHLAAVENSIEVTALLIERGCAIDSQDDRLRTALFIAVFKLSIEITTKLVDAGADVALPVKDAHRTALFEAARSGRNGLLQLLLKKQPQDTWKRLLDIPDHDGHTVLHAAIKAGDVAALVFALDAGANPDIKGLFGSSPLHYASLFGTRDMIAILLSKMVDKHPCNERQEQPLHCAAEMGRLDMVRGIIEAYATEGLPLDLDAQDEHGHTALYSALLNRHTSVAEFLLERGAVSLPTTEGDLPVHLAAEQGLEQLVQTLLAHPGAEKIGYRGRTLLHCAAESGNLTLTKLVFDKLPHQSRIENDTGQTPAMVALAENRAAAAALFLDLDKDVNTRDKNGDSLLHYAVKKGFFDLVVRLAGCFPTDIDAGNEKGITPFLLAVLERDLDILKHFLEISPHAIKAVTLAGDNTSHLAASKGFIEILHPLRSKNFSLDNTNTIGQRPIHNAAARGHYQVLLFLEEQGCSYHAPNDLGYTPLMLAVLNGQIETARYLIWKSSRTQINFSSNILGRSAIILAAIAGFDELFIALLEKGANHLEPDCTGFTATDYAYGPLEWLRQLGSTKPPRAPARDRRSKRTACETIVSCCKTLKDTNTTTRNTYATRCELLIALENTLSRLQDFDCLAIILTDLNLHRPDQTTFQRSFRCKLCIRKFFSDEVCVCKNCEVETILCANCLSDYDQSSQRAPEAILKIRELEATMSRIRQILDTTGLEVELQLQAITITAALWIPATHDAYESWEFEHNRDGQYVGMPRPGQRLVSLAHALHLEMQAKPKSKHGDSQFSTIFEELIDPYNAEYLSLRRDHRPWKLLPVFACAGHEYLIVNCKEYEASGKEKAWLDDNTGMVTDKFLDMLAAKYGPGYQPTDTSDSSLQSQEFEAEQPSQTPVPKIDTSTIELELPIRLKALKSVTGNDSLTAQPRPTEDNPPRPAAASKSILAALEGAGPDTLRDWIYDPKRTVPSVRILRWLYLQLFKGLIVDDEFLRCWFVGLKIAAFVKPSFYNRYKIECIRRMIGDEKNDQKTV